MRNLSPKAVVVGGILDIALTNIVAVPVLAVVIVQGGMVDLPPDEQMKAVSEALLTSPPLYALQMFLGSACSIVGGYVAARMAKREAVLHGALSAFLCVGFGLYAMVVRTDTLPLWVHIAFLPLSPVLGALGGKLWLTRQRPLEPGPSPA